MSVIGINPSRDKIAKSIIYGGGTAYLSLLKFVGGAFLSNPAILNSWSAINKSQEVKDKAWARYCETGDILASLKPFVWNP